MITRPLHWGTRNEQVIWLLRRYAEGRDELGNAALGTGFSGPTRRADTATAKKEIVRLQLYAVSSSPLEQSRLMLTGDAAISAPKGLRLHPPVNSRPVDPGSGRGFPDCLLEFGVTADFHDNRSGRL
jgi:hypothetical protein